MKIVADGSRCIHLRSQTQILCFHIVNDTPLHSLVVALYVQFELSHYCIGVGVVSRCSEGAYGMLGHGGLGGWPFAFLLGLLSCLGHPDGVGWTEFCGVFVFFCSAYTFHCWE